MHNIFFWLCIKLPYYKAEKQDSRFMILLLPKRRLLRHHRRLVIARKRTLHQFFLRLRRKQAYDWYDHKPEKHRNRPQLIGDRIISGSILGAIISIIIITEPNANDT